MGDRGHAHGSTYSRGHTTALISGDGARSGPYAPGCPELALPTTSAARARMVAMQTSSTDSLVNLDMAVGCETEGTRLRCPLRCDRLYSATDHWHVQPALIVVAADISHPRSPFVAAFSPPAPSSTCLSRKSVLLTPRYSHIVLRTLCVLNTNRSTVVGRRDASPAGDGQQASRCVPVLSLMPFTQPGAGVLTWAVACQSAGNSFKPWTPAMPTAGPSGRVAVTRRRTI